MKTVLHDWNISDYLKTPEARAAYLEAAIDENDPAFFAQALADVAAASGRTTLARSMSGIAAYVKATIPVAPPRRRASSAVRMRASRRKMALA